MLRVLVYAPRPKVVGGAEKYTIDLAQSLRRSPRIEKVDLAHVREVTPPRPGEYDVIHAMDLYPERAAFAQRARTPVVFMSHTSPWQFTRQGWHTGRRLPWFRLGQLAVYASNLLRTTFSISHGAAVVAASKNTADGLRLQVPWLKSRIHFVENGVDPERFPVGLGDEGYVLFVGRLMTAKGIDIAVEAAERVGRKLLVAGAGPLESTLRARAPNHVKLLGNVSETDVARLYRGASVCVLPSQSEGYPLTVLEALSSGSPVISTQSFVATAPTGDLIRWLPFGVCAQVPPSRQRREDIVQALSEAIQELWGTKTPENAQRRHDIVRAHNSWTRTVDGIIDVYERVVAAASNK